MDQCTVCDCQFRDHCSTFADPLIRDERKGPEGLGCQGQTNEYRAHHCQVFACSYLSMVVCDGFRHMSVPGTAVKASC